MRLTYSNCKVYIDCHTVKRKYFQQETATMIWNYIEDPADFLKQCRLTAPQIVEDIGNILK